MSLVIKARLFSIILILYNILVHFFATLLWWPVWYLMLTHLLLSPVQEGGSWQAALRALYALEAVVEQGSSASCGEVAVFFQVRRQGTGFSGGPVSVPVPVPVPVSVFCHCA